ncbi:hypothetical protein CSUB01_10791 [Colletotrichum sublineola]|uniref:Uncharacterized protein n=1 Tax=Colletotrichum sublineola TaxID=1173701 RepID=A0A066XN45_COLSU|nr:hypothetical protein CSUB01_10791 [Colletotrichum sublineola]
MNSRVEVGLQEAGDHQIVYRRWANRYKLNKHRSLTKSKARVGICGDQQPRDVIRDRYAATLDPCWLHTGRIISANEVVFNELMIHDGSKTSVTNTEEPARKRQRVNPNYAYCADYRCTQQTTEEEATGPSGNEPPNGPSTSDTIHDSIVVNTDALPAEQRALADDSQLEPSRLRTGRTFRSGYRLPSYPPRRHKADRRRYHTTLRAEFPTTPSYVSVRHTDYRTPGAKGDPAGAKQRSLGTVALRHEGRRRVHWWKTASGTSLKHHQTAVPFREDPGVIVNGNTSIVVYVDDRVVAGPGKAVIQKRKDAPSKRFQMTDLDFKTPDGDPVSTPMETVNKLEEALANYEAPIQLKSWYARPVGSLMYAMLGTRPDIARLCCLILPQAPREAYYRARESSRASTKIPSDLETCYEGDVGRLNGYADSDRAGDHSTRRSTAGYLFNVPT